MLTNLFNPSFQHLMTAIHSLGLLLLQHLLFIHFLARAWAAAVHCNIFSVLQSNSLFAFTDFNPHHLWRNTALRLHSFIQRHCRHILRTPNTWQSLSGYYLWQLELTLIDVFLCKVHLLLHVLFKLVNWDVFWHCCQILLVSSCEWLLSQPGEYFFVGVGLALLVCHVVAVRWLLVELG